MSGTGVLKMLLPGSYEHRAKHLKCEDNPTNPIQNFLNVFQITTVFCNLFPFKINHLVDKIRISEWPIVSNRFKRYK